MSEYTESIDIADGGRVQIIDVMASDADICRDTRITTGSRRGTPEEDRKLIRSLMKRGEMSPFEQAHLKFRIKLPLYVANHLVRYRTAHLQAFSQRYREAIDEMATTPPDGWRKQAEDRKQGSVGPLTEWPEGWAVERSALGDWLITSPDEDFDKFTGIMPCTGPGSPSPTIGEFLTEAEEQLQEKASHVYATRLALGVAREQARKDLPLSNFTEWTWTIDLRNLLHLIAERWPGRGVQCETGAYAEALATFVRERFPETWAAFENYRLYAVTFSRSEVEALREVVQAALAAGFAFDGRDSAGDRILDKLAKGG